MQATTSGPWPPVGRRAFAGAVAGAALAAGRARAVPPSERINLGFIGLGPRNQHNLRNFLELSEVRVAAVCDCAQDRREAAKQIVDGYYRNRDCASFRMHEEILAEDGIDAVVIGTGDRWHTLMSVLAAKAGKDVYCEKPFSMTVAEGWTLVDVMKRYGTVWQCGTQRRSNPGYKFVVDLVRSGRIGKLRSVTTSFGGMEAMRRDAIPKPEAEPDPEQFDYDRWLGPSPWAPYSKARVQAWRLNWDTCGGALTDMGPHYFDFAQWAHGTERSGPVEFEGEGYFLERAFHNNIPYMLKAVARYADGLRLYMDTQPKGVRFDGDEGWVRLDDDEAGIGSIQVSRPWLLQDLSPPESGWKISIPHLRNFIECIKTRQEPVSGPEVAQRGHTIAHCANIAVRLGRKLVWDPCGERFIDDEEANRMLVRTFRPPWRL